MAERTVVISEAEPGIVHVSTELLHEMLTQLGARRVAPKNGGDFEYVVRDKPTPESSHPDTMIGRRNHRALTDGCHDCGASLVLCASLATHERRRCCDRCQHPE